MGVKGFSKGNWFLSTSPLATCNDRVRVKEQAFILLDFFTKKRQNITAIKTLALIFGKSGAKVALILAYFTGKTVLMAG